MSALASPPRPRDRAVIWPQHPRARPGVFRYPRRMLRPWPTSTTLPLSALSLVLACSSVGVEQDSNSSSTATTGGGSGSSPTADPSTDPTSDTPTTGSDSNTTILTSLSDTGTGVDPTTDPTTATSGPGSSGMISTDSDSETASSTATGTSGSSSSSGSDSSSSTGPLPEGCDDGLQNGDETDKDCGGSCPACALDLMCLVDADCDSLSCEGGVCVEATCDDGKQDGVETDVDCGGGVCDLCLDGDSCAVGEDCESAVCTDKICQPAACDDMVLNQDETDLDCGGSCDPCANDKKCVVDDDCVNKICTDNLCVAAACDDGVQNGPETDIDCGGPSCAPCQLEGLIINEVDYDQVGDDIDEFVEIYNNTGADVDLAKIHLVLANGNGNATYLDQSLAAAGVLKQGAYLVVGSGTVVVPPGTAFVKLGKAKDNVQNGNPDGIALVDTGAVKLLDALSYGGAMTMANVTGLGVVSLVEGTALKANVIDSNQNIGSLIRFPNGNDKNDANTEWLFSKNPTPGAANKP